MADKPLTLDEVEKLRGLRERVGSYPWHRHVAYNDNGPIRWFAAGPPRPDESDGQAVAATDAELLSDVMESLPSLLDAAEVVARLEGMRDPSAGKFSDGWYVTPDDDASWHKSELYPSGPTLLAATRAATRAADAGADEDKDGGKA